MRATLVVVANVMIAAGVCGMAAAGSIDSPGLPAAGSGMYSLSQIYDYVNSGIETTPISGFQEPGSSPGSTMRTTTEIYDIIHGNLSQCEIHPEDVTPGKKYFSTIPGWWGVRVGGTPMPTGTPTITPTPTITSSPTITPTPTATFACGVSTITDSDSNIYQTVQIGTQCWLGENLRTRKKPNGDALPTSPRGYWGYPNGQGGCSSSVDWDLNGSNDCGGQDGLLYKWDTMMNGSTTESAQGICPDGWHIPSHNEWTDLERAVCTAVCTTCNCGNEFPKNTTDINVWLGPSGKGVSTTLQTVSSSTFSAHVNGAYFSGSSSYANRQLNGYYWTSTNPSSAPWFSVINNDSEPDRVWRGTNYYGSDGLSVRCLKN